MDSTGWDERYRTDELIWSAEPNRFVEAEVGALKPGRALDLAAGEGRNSVWLASRGWQVTGVDFSEVGLEKAARLAGQAGVADRVEWVRADLRHWSPAPASFDLVVIAYLHLPAGELTPVVTAAAGALAGGGKLVVVGHDAANLEGGVGGPQDPDVLYHPETLRAVLTDAGLSVTRAETVDRPTPNGTALDTLVTAIQEKGRLK